MAVRRDHLYPPERSPSRHKTPRREPEGDRVDFRRQNGLHDLVSSDWPIDSTANPALLSLPPRSPEHGKADEQQKDEAPLEERDPRSRKQGGRRRHFPQAHEANHRVAGRGWAQRIE